MTHVHEISRLEKVVIQLEKENEHLKEVLSTMADTMFRTGRYKDLQPALEALVVKWMHHANKASVRAVAAERELAER